VQLGGGGFVAPSPAKLLLETLAVMQASDAPSKFSITQFCKNENKFYLTIAFEFANPFLHLAPYSIYFFLHAFSHVFHLLKQTEYDLDAGEINA